MLIWNKINIMIVENMLKAVVLLNIFVETQNYIF